MKTFIKTVAQNLKSKAMESVDDESAVDAAALPLAQAKTSVEHVVLQQDALAHPENLHHNGDVYLPILRICIIVGMWRTTICS